MDNAQHDRAGRAGPRILRRLLPLALLAAVAVVVVYNGWHDHLSLQQVADNRDMLRQLVTDRFVLALAGYMAVYVAVVSLSLPGGALLTVTGGFLFGWAAAGCATVVAATAGATIVFLIARTSLGETLVSRAGPRLDRVASGFRDNALSYMLFLRLVPAFPFWLVNLAPALLGVPLGTYVLGTALGIIPGTFAFAVLGAGLDSIIDAQKQARRECLARADGTDCTLSLDPASLLTPELIAAFVALGIVALIPVLVRGLRRRDR